MRRLLPVLIVPGLLLLSIQPAAAAAPTDLVSAQLRQAQLAQVRSQLGDVIAGNLQAQQQVTDALAANRREAESLNAQVAAADAKLAALDAELAGIDSRRAILGDRIAAERRQLDRIARALYVQPDSLVLTLAQAGSLGDAIGDVAGLQSASAHARALQQQLERDQAQLTADRKRQAAAEQEQAAIRDGLRSKADRLRELNAQQTSALADLLAKAAASRAELASVNFQSAATAAYIASALEAQQAEATAAAYQAVWQQVQLIGGEPPSKDTPSGLANPLPGAPVTQGFGPSTYTFEPPFGGYAHFHTGIDYGAPRGTPVLAAGEGTVVLAGFNSGGYGNYVVISHGGGLDTLYGHLDSLAVRQGQHVDRGQPLGAEGSTGNSTGAHLHFEVRRAGQPVDPAPFLH